MIGWGGEDVPGHPVPINKEGNACMHMQRDNEGIRLPKLLGLAVAGATLLAGMVVLPATQASAADDQYGFAAEDEFVEGDLDSTKVPQLTVTKYLSLADNYAATGSAKDIDQLNKNKDLTPAKGILFKVTEVQPLPDKGWADIDANDSSTYTVKSGGTALAGVTDGHGVIDKWYGVNSDGSVTIDSSGNITGTVTPFPAGADHYYILSEDQDNSPAFSESNKHKLDKKNYKAAQNSLFSLPYATNGTDQNKTRGFIYHLHLYPKNMNTREFAKTVQSVKGPNGTAKTQTTATAGDTITYKLSQKIHNDGNKAAKNDGLLDVKELAGNSADVRLADRMSSSLKGDPTTIKAYIRSTGANPKTVELKNTTDFTTDTSTNENPARLNTPDQKMFADVPSTDVTYWVFNFFTTSGVSKVNSVGTSVMELEVTYDALVTGNGDSTGTGGVVNDAASDFSDNRNADGPLDPVPSHTNVTNAVLAFGSVQSKNQDPKYGALPGTEYRLVKDDKSIDKYLGSDGNFYGSKDEVPAGVQIYKATANDKGLVVFAALPIFETGTKAAEKADKTVQNTSWKVIETKTPDGWSNPGAAFGTVTFGDVGSTEETIVQKYGNNATLQADYTKLSFGRYDVPGNELPQSAQMMFNNELVSKYMAHYKKTDADAPLALPLTGGRGILLLLVVGALLMGGALYARSRRNNAARA